MVAHMVAMIVPQVIKESAAAFCAFVFQHVFAPYGALLACPLWTLDLFEKILFSAWLPAVRCCGPAGQGAPKRSMSCL